MNEFGEVIGWWFIRTGKMEELEDSIKGLKKRYEMNGFTPPVIVYSDRPEMTRSLWERIWSSLRPDIPVIPSGHVSLPLLSLPADRQVIVVTRLDECTTHIDRLRNLVEGQKDGKIVGLDVEWNQGLHPVATIQVSTVEGNCFIFCLKGILGKRYFSYLLLRFICYLFMEVFPCDIYLLMKSYHWNLF
jgi:hypothetical protein